MNPFLRLVLAIIQFSFLVIFIIYIIQKQKQKTKKTKKKIIFLQKKKLYF